MKLLVFDDGHRFESPFFVSIGYDALGFFLAEVGKQAAPRVLVDGAERGAEIDHLEKQIGAFDSPVLPGETHQIELDGKSYSAGYLVINPLNEGL